MANYNYRLQQQHVAMARKRQRRRAAAQTADAARHDMQGQHPLAQAQGDVAGNGATVNIRQISAGDEGVLYTHRIAVSSYWHPWYRQQPLIKMTCDLYQIEMPW